MKALLELFRPLTSFIAALATFVGALVGAGVDIVSSSISIFLALIVVFLFSAAGFVMNDYYDREIDRINHPNRPIPSGRIKAESALKIAVIVFIVGIIIAWFINIICFIITIVALLLQISYEKNFKRKGFVGNVSISSLAALTFFFGGAAVEQMSAPSILALLAFFSILGREIIMDIEDVKGDIDRNTLPVKIGERKSAIIASSFLSLAVVMSPIPYYPMQIFSAVYLPFVGIADAMFIYSMFIQLKNPKLSRITTRIAMLIALMAFIIGGLT
jgi:geranylgeranylglycerol-phosphate geranylgeranyltransferase